MAVDVMQRILLYRTTHHSRNIVILNIVHYFTHVCKGGFVQDKAKRALLVVFTQENDRSFKIRVRQIGFRDQESALFRLQFIAVLEKLHFFRISNKPTIRYSSK